MAWCSPQLRWVYNPMQRTASKAVRQLLRQEYQGEQVGRHHDVAIISGYLHFASVRNPYFRVLSRWWAFYRRQCRDPGWPGRGKTYREWLEALCRNRARRIEWRLGSCVEQLGSAPVDAVVRYEALLEDLRALPFVNGSVELGRGDRAARKQDRRGPIPFAEMYSDSRAMSLLLEHSAEDFERFGYSTDLPDVEMF